MNLFIASSPFQVLSAFEAIESFELKDSKNIFLILYGLNKAQNQQIKSVLALYSQVVNIEVHEINYESNIRFFLSKLIYLKRIKNKAINFLFIGHLNEYFNQLAICNIKCKSVFVIDDGAATIKQNEDFNQPLTLFKIHNLTKPGGIIKKVITTLTGFKDQSMVAINWFSMFKFIPSNGNKYFTHSFALLKDIEENKLLNKKSLSDKIYFIGANLVNAKVLISKNSYKELLGNIFENVGNNSNLVYVPHRFEELDFLEDIFCKYNVEIIRPNTIIEIFFVQNQIIPSRIISFYSTALFSLNKIYPYSKIEFCPLDLNIISPQFRTVVESVQDYYSQFFDKLIIK